MGHRWSYGLAKAGLQPRHRAVRSEGKEEEEEEGKGSKCCLSHGVRLFAHPALFLVWLNDAVPLPPAPPHPCARLGWISLSRDRV